jgi:hypothetical protein
MPLDSWSAEERGRTIPWSGCGLVKRVRGGEEERANGKSLINGQPASGYIEFAALEKIPITQLAIDGDRMDRWRLAEIFRYH